MNPQLAKEVRLLLPAWIAALVLVAASLPAGTEFLQHAGESQFTGFLFAALALGSVILGVSSFSREFSQQTFQWFLSHPASRADLWNHKIRILGVASLSVWLVFWILISIFHGFSVRTGLLSLAAVAAVASTGLWTSLIVRHAVGAFCLSLLLVILGSILLDGLVARFADNAQFPALFSIWTVYAAAAFLFARWLFLRAQDLDSWNVNLELVLPRGRPETLSPVNRTGGVRHPIRALIAKEFRLHQLTLIGGSILYLAILLPTLLFIRDDQSRSFEAVQAAFLLLWLLFPILIGAAAIAEERKLGVHQGNQCLPVPPRIQFMVKLGVALTVLALFALAFPLTVYGLFGTLAGLRLLGEANWLNLLGVLATYSVIAGGTAWYFSSLSRTTLASLIATFITLAVGFFLMGYSEELWHGGRLFRWIAIPALLIAAVVLSFINIRKHLLNSRVWRKNAAVLAGVTAIILLLTPLIYYRTWEWVMPEPAIGKPHPALENGAVIYGGTHWLPWIVHLPDGRVWFAHSPATPLHKDRRYPATFPDGGEFVEREDWVRLVSNHNEVAGLRADGTLWHFAINPERTRIATQPFAEDARWKDLAAGQNHFLAVKDDGTLWGWGFNRQSQLGIEPTEERIESPVRIGQDSDWYRVHAAQEYSVGVKEDGTLWHWGRLYREERSPEPIGVSLPGFPIHFANVFNTYTWLTVLDDRTLWTIDLRSDLPRPPTLPHRIGADDDWIFAASAWHGSYVALKEDGSLRGANILRHEHARKFTWEPFERLSSKPVWAGVSPSHHGIYALAKDGTWWTWERSEDYETLLAPSRRPQRIDTSQ